MTCIVIQIHLTDPIDFFTLTPTLETVSPMAISRWLSNGKRSKQRIDDSGGDMSLSEDYPTDTLPLSSEPSDPSLQAWERMAIRTFGSGAMDPRADQTTDRIVKETWQ
jgi:hypothetical protein